MMYALLSEKSPAQAVQYDAEHGALAEVENLIAGGGARVKR